jgi:hypothetical protein
MTGVEAPIRVMTHPPTVRKLTWRYRLRVFL